MLSDAEVLRVAVQIDASACGDEASAIGSRVDTELKDLFLEASVLGGTSEDPQLMLTVEPYADVENPGYSVEMRVSLDGQALAGASSQLRCDLCTHGELADKVRAATPALLDSLRAELARIEAEAQAASTPEGPEAGTGTDPAANTKADRAKLGPLGFTGIAASVVGAASIGGGAALLAKGDTYEGTGLDQRRRKGPGAAILGVGVGALVTGVTLIVIDRVRAKKSSAPKR